MLVQFLSILEDFPEAGELKTDSFFGDRQGEKIIWGQAESFVLDLSVLKDIKYFRTKLKERKLQVIVISI